MNTSLGESSSVSKFGQYLNFWTQTKNVKSRNFFHEIIIASVYL